ncbi:EAL domain-containing response regulator [Sphingosinicella terrae]|uniref:EAL domain-containing response regulator n=1 Tax=Sphingosinicella terrae TaxID=2172047 RepID=UPI0025475471|nr:EAL domain-containing protein [Sphingosinicella terrae]
MQTPKTILIVDDNPINLGVLVDHLEDHGYEVIVAQGGAEAIKRAEFVQPDLILLDVMMPGLDGFETCRRLKSGAATSAIPVIFMTALIDIHDKVAAFAAGGVDYVSKPFQNEELLARVRTHIELRSVQRRLAAQNLELQNEMGARRAAQSALRASELQYRRLFETATDGILLLDSLSGEVTDANPAFVAMVGLPRNLLVGRVLNEIGSFRAVGAAKSCLSDLHEFGSIKYDDWVLQSGDGSPIAVEVVGSCYEADGSPIVQFSFRNISDRRAAEARALYMAHHDALTGLPNRLLLADRLKMAMANARRNHKRAAVLMLDLDHFKHINDSLGHHIGDKLLEGVAARLRSSLRATDTAARIGGDEFVVILPDLENAEDPAIVAEKIRGLLADPFVIGNLDLRIGCSIGVSVYPGDGEDGGALLRAADIAMYHAKESGRNTQRFFTPELNAAAQRWHLLSNDVRGAWSRGEFVLHYQPQISLATKTVAGLEALLRWNHPTEGLIAPAQFIPILEELGMMAEVGAWVLQTACRQNAQWQRQGIPPVRLAVNVSAQQFYRGDIVKTVQESLSAAGLEPHWLELELTESLSLDETDVTVGTMRRLKALGVTLSVDDFGTGWSSLSYLRRFPLDRIKIDRSFMRDLATHSTTATVVQSILNLARNLGLNCVAEGVETTEQLSYLQDELCGEIQGFLFSEALPAHDLPSLLTSSDWLHRLMLRPEAEQGAGVLASLGERVGFATQLTDDLRASGA